MTGRWSGSNRPDPLTTKPKSLKMSQVCRTGMDVWTYVGKYPWGVYLQHYYST